MAKKRRKLKKKPVYLLIIVVIIIAIFFKFNNNHVSKLERLGYKDDVISLIKEKKLESEIEKRNHIPNLADIIGDKYFLLKNFDRYIAYSKNNSKNIVRDVNCNLDKSFYEDAVNSDTSDGLLLIVNKYYKIDSGYHYGELVSVSKEYSVNNYDKLSSVVYEAFKKLVDAAEKEKLYIRSKSAYRSYNTQENLYNNYKKVHGLEWTEKWSAHPGYSEHQTGLALDVCSKSTGTIQAFEETKEFTWMKDNAYKYGFILRYPEGKENITGYNYEPWHYRYVGKEVAKYIYDNDITFEEYWAYFVDK